MNNPEQIQITPEEFEACCKVAEEIEGKIILKKYDDKKMDVERWARSIISSTVLRLSSEVGIGAEKSTLLYKAIEGILVNKGALNRIPEETEKQPATKTELRTKPIVSTSDALSEWDKKQE